MLSALYEKVQRLFRYDDELEAEYGPEIRPDRTYRSTDSALQGFVAARDGERLTAGMLSVVGLQAARELLGDDWARVEADVNRVTSLVASQLVQGDEVAIRYDGETTLFGLKPSDAAEARMDAAADAMQAALEQQVPEIAGTIAVDHFVAELPPEALTGATDLADCILANLERIRHEARSVSRDTSGLWLRGTRLLFQPMWDPRSVSTGPNRCVLELVAGGSLAQLTQSSDRDVIAEATARHDFIVLSKSIEALHEGIRDGRPCTLLVPVHHLTLNGPWRCDYLKMCALVPRAYRRHVQAELVDVPADATTDDLARLRRRLRLLTDSLVVQLNPARTPGDLAASGVEGISLSFGEMGRSHSGLVKALVGLTKFASLAGLGAYATSVTTIGHALAARDAGFSFIGGTAIHPTLDAPRPQTRYSPLPHSARWSPSPVGVR